MDFRSIKIIKDPLLGIVDVTEIIPLMDTAHFQSLGYKHQLGFAANVFPAATHTRKQHSLGAYERTKRLVSDWLDYGFINKEQAKNLPIFALYHDIGHGPFSHVTEPLGSVDHNKRGLSILESLSDVIRGAGFDYEMIHNLFSRKDSLYLAVSDKNLGMEKLDYLERDAFYTIGDRPGVEFLSHHVCFVDGKVAINEGAVDQAKDIQNFYIKMYKNVYHRKKPAILQRLLEKMTYYLMQDGLSENELFSMTDFGLFGKLETSSNKNILAFFDKFKTGTFPKLALELKHDSVASQNNQKKQFQEVGIEESLLNKLISENDWYNFDFLESVERDIEKNIGSPENSVIIIQPQDKRRVEPDDINVYLKNGSMSTISNMYPDHFQAMREYGRSHLSLRIAVFDDYREKLYDSASEVKKYFLSLNK